MKKLSLIALFALILAGCSSIPFLNKKQAALQVNASPTASVYLNGNHVGQTPYFDDKIKPGEYTVRILVENDPAKDWSTQLNLQSQIVTVVNRMFGATPEESSNYQLQLEALSSKTATELSVVTIPDNVIVKIDGQPEGFSPLSVKDIEEGDHTLILTAPGYQEMTIQTQTKKGYKLAASATLGKIANAPETDDQIASDSAQLKSDTATKSASLTPTGKVSPTAKPTGKTTPSPTGKLTPTVKPTGAASGTLEKPYVVIKDTPTGWLRVRKTPSTSAEEIAKVNPGEEYKFVEANESGWYLIVLEDGSEGWISGTYAQLIK